MLTLRSLYAGPTCDRVFQRQGGMENFLFFCHPCNFIFLFFCEGVGMSVDAVSRRLGLNSH